MTDFINHPDIARFAIIRQEYVAITQGNHCAAMLLSIIEGYTGWAVTRGQVSPYIELTGVELSHLMSGIFGRKAIMAAGALLDRLGLVRRKHKLNYDRTYQYLLLPDVVQMRVNLATTWDATLKVLFLRVRGTLQRLPNIQWLDFGSRWLGALWGLNVPIRPMQESLLTISKKQSDLLNVPQEPFSIELTKISQSTANKSAAAPENFSAPEQDQEASQKQTDTQPAEPQSTAQPQQSTEKTPSRQQGRENDNNSHPNPETVEILKAVAETGWSNSTIRAEVLKLTMAEVMAAIVIVQKRVEKGGVKDPQALFMSCLKGKWWKEISLTQQDKECASSSQKDWTQHPDWAEWLQFMRSSESGLLLFRGCKQWLDFQSRCEIASFVEANNLLAVK